MKRIKIHSFFLALLFFFVIVGCTKSLKVTPRSPDKSVLYVSRGDSAFSGIYTVKFFLNGKEITELTYDTYQALHIKPGTYEIDFRAGKSKEDLKSVLKFTEKIEPNTVKFCSVAHAFLAWRGPKKLLEGKDVLLYKKFKFLGEIDLTKTISPK